MNAIILTAEETRQFVQSGTITKTISTKSTYIRHKIGDAVYVREPWIRLKDPKTGEGTNRFTYASSATGEQPGRSWASPVSMPTDAIRYYAKITDILTDVDERAQSLTITLITKAEAEPIDAGGYYPEIAAPVPENEPELPVEDKFDPSFEPVRYTVGHCPHCGREWSGLARPGEELGAPASERGFATQEEADAHAGEICVCNEAVFRRSYEGSITGVTAAIMTGTCKYCGQVVEIGGGYYRQEEADITASEICNCWEAKAERTALEQIASARDNIQKLFGREAAESGLIPIEKPEPVELLNNLVELVARRHISSATVQLRGYCRAKVSLTPKLKIKVERAENKVYQLEAAE